MEQKPRIVSPMSNEGRNSYVIEHMTSSLLELLKEKPLSEISIRTLCDRAGVGRTSFYRNFETKEDILRTYIQQLFQTWMEDYDRAANPPVSEWIYTIFAHFEAKRDFYSLLNQRGLVYLLKDVILTLCGFDPAQEIPVAYASAFAAYSLYGWIEVWFQRGMRESAEELAALLRAQGK